MIVIVVLVLCCGESKLNSIILEMNLFAKKNQKIVDWTSRLGKRRFGKCKKIETKSKKSKNVDLRVQKSRKHRFSGRCGVVGCKN